MIRPSDACRLVLWQWLWLLYVVALRQLSVPGDCEFPADWQGKWFESGLGDVIVTSHNISRKGFCLANVNDFYLLENQYAGKTETNSFSQGCICQILTGGSDFSVFYRTKSRSGPPLPPHVVGVKAIAAGNFRQIVLKIANFEAKSEKIHVWHHYTVSQKKGPPWNSL